MTSERSKYLAKIFSLAISQYPNNAGKTARALVELCGNREVFEEIMAGMNDPESDLAHILANAGTAFHKMSDSDSAPTDDILPTDLAGMARKIRAHSGF